jgi:TetR/AcrR family transcriptional regulator, transcriptional repressor of aconitase
VVRVVVELDPAWLGVYLELFRRVRTDAEFRARIEARNEQLAPANRARIEEAQRSGEFRDDLGAKEIGTFVNLVLNGLALMRAGGEDLPKTDLVLGLLRDAIGARPGRRGRTPA